MAIYAIATTQASPKEMLNSLAKLQDDLLSLDEKKRANYDLAHIEIHLRQCRQLISSNLTLDSSSTITGSKATDNNECILYINLHKHILYSSQSTSNMTEHFPVLEIKHQTLAGIGLAKEAVLDDLCAQTQAYLSKHEKSKPAISNQCIAPTPLYSKFLFSNQNLFEVTAGIHFDTPQYKSMPTPQVRTLNNRNPYIKVTIRKHGLLNISHIKHPCVQHLSEAERDIVQRLCYCETPQQISDARGRSLATVRTQIKTIFEKLQVSSLSQLIVMLYAQAKQAP